MRAKTIGLFQAMKEGASLIILSPNLLVRNIPNLMWVKEVNVITKEALAIVVIAIIMFALSTNSA
jgi:hypothetical protein